MSPRRYAEGAVVVDLWHIELPRVTLADDLLVASEHARADRLVVEEKRLQFLRGRTALRSILGHYLEVEPGAVALSFGRHGRPELAGGELSFNLSHSGDLALLAVASERLVLGVDVEQVDNQRPLLRIARRFFAPAELRDLESLPDARLSEVFYRGWTRKEAYVKALGTGLSFSSRRFAIDLDPGSGRLLKITEWPGDRVDSWWFEDVATRPGFAAALCWLGDRRPVRRASYP